MHIEYSPALRINGKHLHSQYNPHEEAVRFVRAAGILHTTTCIILIGDGLGYPTAALKEKAPHIRILVLQPIDKSPAPNHMPAHTETLHAAFASNDEKRRWIRQKLHPLQILNVEVLKWHAAQHICPEWLQDSEHAAISALQDLQSELATTASFGRIWIANALYRNLQQHTRVTIQAECTSCIIAGAGHSLYALRHLPQSADTIPIIAASSAFHFLHTQYRDPAIVMHTDGGYWTQRYLHEIGEAEIPPLASDTEEKAHCIAALPLHASRGRIKHALLLQSNILTDMLAPDSKEWPAVSEQPSVGASLLSMAASFFPHAALLLAGIDLCSYGMQSHAHPHANDIFIAKNTTRLSTEETIRQRRLYNAEPVEKQWHDGIRAYTQPALQCYKDPILSAAALHRGSIHCIVPSPVWKDDMPAAGPAITRTRSTIRHTSINRPPLHTRKAHARTVLMRWTDMLRTNSVQREFPNNRELQELLLYLAPLSTIKACRSQLEIHKAAHEAATVLHQLLIRSGCVT